MNNNSQETQLSHLNICTCDQREKRLQQETLMPIPTYVSKAFIRSGSG